MTTPTTGQISFSQIISEFGPSNPDAQNGLPSRSKLGSYRVNQTIGGRNWTLDGGVPTSGSISFSQLRGKTLNVVVDYVGGETTSVGTAKDNFSNSGVVVGGFKGRPTSSETKKVYNLIRRKIGNGLSSGDWDSNTVLLNFTITGSGAIYGYGGNGGAGANIDENAPQPNQSFYSSRTNSIRYGPISGGHALSVSYNSTIVVESGGILAGGGGGGGGGGYQYNGGDDARGAGQGGGGGAGYPAGTKGAAGYVNDGGRNGNVCQGNVGSDGTLTTGGAGGPVTCYLTGGNNGGAGGAGGDIGGAGGAGQNKSNGAGSSGAGPGNSVYHPGVTISLSNSGTVSGPYT
jgi:hypothetical protein